MEEKMLWTCCGSDASGYDAEYECYCDDEEECDCDKGCACGDSRGEVVTVSEWRERSHGASGPWNDRWRERGSWCASRCECANEAREALATSQQNARELEEVGRYTDEDGDIVHVCVSRGTDWWHVCTVIEGHPAQWRSAHDTHAGAEKAALFDYLEA